MSPNAAFGGGPTASNPFPENELPRWLLRQGLVAAQRMRVALRPPQYKLLAGFSRDLRMCLRSTSDMVRGLELCIKPIRNTVLGDRWKTAAEKVRGGATLAEALDDAEGWLPPFFLPVIRAGEQSGRLEEALAFLETHCTQLSGPAVTLRNFWLFPVAIMLGGSVLSVFLVLLWGLFGDAAALFVQELLGFLKIALLIALLMLTPARYFVDQLRLSLPWVGPLEREIAVHRFFRVLALLFQVAMGNARRR